MAKYGYIRKKGSTESVKQLEKIISYNCDEIFIEEEAYQTDDELLRLMKTIGENDTLIVESISSFGKTTKELNRIFKLCIKKNIHFISWDDQLDSKKMYSFFELSETLFKINAEVKSFLAKERIAISKKRGSQHGRPPLEREKIEKIRRLSQVKKKSMREIATECDVSLGTVHKYLKTATELEASDIQSEERHKSIA